MVETCAKNCRRYLLPSASVVTRLATFLGERALMRIRVAVIAFRMTGLRTGPCRQVRRYGISHTLLARAARLMDSGSRMVELRGYVLLQFFISL